MDTTTGRIAPGWARTRGAVPEGGDLLGRPRLLARLGEAGRARVLERHDVDREAAKLAALFAHAPSESALRVSRAAA